MFDKFLCKHIQKKTIRLGDIASLVVPYCLLGGFAWFASIGVGALCYEMFGHRMLPDPSIRDLLNCTAIGISVLSVALISFVVGSKILKIEVAHCPMKEDEER